MTKAAKRPIKHLRWYIAGLLCLSSEINYLDRQTLSVLADTIQKDLGLSTVDYSHITAAFLWSYTVMYAVSGRLIDFLGVRRGFLIFVSGWSIANMLHGFASTVGQFRFFRALLGAAEPGNFPGGVKAVAEWFPVRERALAIGIFNAGTAIGSTLATPLVTIIALTLGWRWAFVMTGSLGAFWVVAWALIYRTPETHPRLSEEERLLILGEPSALPTMPAAVPLRRLLSMRETWGCVLARVLTDPISYFLLFWTPKYLQQERGFDLATLGKYGWIPFVGAALGNLFGGLMPRWLCGRGLTLDRSRKSAMFAVSCLVPMLCYLVTRVQSPGLAVAALTAIMWCHGAWANITLPAEVFPTHVLGTITGVAGSLGALTSALTQPRIGQVVQSVGFAPLFSIGAFAYLGAFVVVAVLLHDLGRIRAV